MPAPIALFAFNRPDHLQRTLDALAGNALAGQSALTIFCDGPRHEEEQEKTNAVRRIAHAAQGFVSVAVVERERNWGCANAVIDGLTQMFAKHERLIVIEDDILTSPYTLQFLNMGLEKYQDKKTVFNIAAWSPPPKVFPVPHEYPYDVYAMPRFNGWGWASWRDRFALVDWSVSDYTIFCKNQTLQNAFNQGGADLTPMLHAQMEGKLDTWDVQVDYARFKHGLVGINPVRSYTTNIGHGSGTHTTEYTTRWDNDVALARGVSEDFRWLEHIFVDEGVRTRYCAALAPELPPLWKRTARSILASLGLLEHVKKWRRRAVSAMPNREKNNDIWGVTKLLDKVPASYISTP